MDKRYVKCNRCDKRVYFGSKVFRYKGFCGIYCSAECFADTFCEANELNETVADNCCCTVYDDEKRKRELTEMMKRLQEEMELCQTELQSLNNNTK